MSDDAARLRAGLEHLKLIRRALEMAYTDTGHGCFLRQHSGEYVPSPFIALTALESLLRAVPPAQEAAPERRCDLCDQPMLEIICGDCAATPAQAPPAPPDGLADVVDQAGWAVAQCKDHGRIIEALQARIAALEDGQ